MSTFKEIAFQVLEETGKPLHSKEITNIALNRGLLKTAGKTPEATMNAALIVDINEKKKRSQFLKVAPSVFTLNTNLVSENITLSNKKNKKQRVQVHALIELEISHDETLGSIEIKAIS